MMLLPTFRTTLEATHYIVFVLTRSVPASGPGSPDQVRLWAHGSFVRDLQACRYV